MTVRELLELLEKRGISIDTPIAIRDKDDFLLVERNVSIDKNPYFGNCANGEKYLMEVAPKDEDGDIDWQNLPMFLILGTGT